MILIGHLMLRRTKMRRGKTIRYSINYEYIFDKCKTPEEVRIEIIKNKFNKTK